MSTIIQQGKFTSDGTAKTLNLRADIDWMEVFNATIADADQTTAVGVQYYWQRGMADDTGIEYKKSNAAAAANLTDLMASGGFTRVSGFSLGAAVSGAGITKADPPVCTANGHGFSDGDVVMLTNLTEMPQLAGIFFTIGSTDANTFELTYMNTNTSNFTVETAFTVRKVIGFPAWNQSSQAVIGMTTGATTAVTFAAANSNFAVGDVMRINQLQAYGVGSIGGQQGKVLSINTTTNTYTLDIDSTSAGTFAFPAASAVPFTGAEAIPVGTVNQSSASDAEQNLAQIQMVLAAGANSPAGSSSDVIYWRAGKSFSVSND